MARSRFFLSDILNCRVNDFDPGMASPLGVVSSFRQFPHPLPPQCASKSFILRNRMAGAAGFSLADRSDRKQRNSPQFTDSRAGDGDRTRDVQLGNMHGVCK